MMRNFKNLLMAGAAGIALCATHNGAQAGGFALREQSAVGLGNAFAGAAAGGSGLGSMFWNPATITNYAGINSSLSLFAILPYSKISPTSATNPLLTTYTANVDSGDMAQDAVVPASYASYQINQQLWLGLSINAPYGLVTKNPSNWPGQVLARTSKVKAIEVTPSLAYALNDSVSVGAGLRIVHFGVFLTSAAAPSYKLEGATPVPNSLYAGASSGELKGNDNTVGFTLGTTVKPWNGGEVGIGYRSQIKPKLTGSLVAPAGNTNISPILIPGNYDIKSSVVIPEQVSVGLRQQITSEWTLLAGFEWTNWSKFGRFPVYVSSGASNGALATTLTFDYRDGWFTSLGGEYKFNRDWTLRAGLGFEHAPINNTNRSARLPDSNRIWTSLGATYLLDDQFSLDISYAHLFARNGTITQTQDAKVFNTSYTLYANTKGRVDIFGIGLNVKLGADPKKSTAKAAMVTK